MKTRVIKMLVAYDGTCYSGFQRQSNAKSVQKVLEKVFCRVFGESNLTLVAAGRTDSGVHATGQVVSVKTTGNIDVESIVPACNGILPHDISIKKAEDVNTNFHALRDARGKQYIYCIYNHKVSDPFMNRYAWHIKKNLSCETMNEAAKVLIGTHDFSAFRSSNNSSTTNSVRTVYDAGFIKNSHSPALIEFFISGNGFLYHMVRNLVGALVEVGKNKMTAVEFSNVLQSCDRSKQGRTAPPQGLFLREVYYD